MAKQERDVVQSALTVLTSAAMALPGVSRAMTPPEKPEFGFRWEMYNEDQTPNDLLSSGSPYRYDIDAYYFHLVLPYTERVSFVANMDYETMSGATPWYVAPDDNDATQSPENAKVVMTGASVDDTRTDISGAATYYLDEGILSAGAGMSKEEDYTSLYGSLSTSLEFYDKHVVADLGVSFSSDKLTPTPGKMSGRTQRKVDETRGSVSLYAGFTQVLNRLSTYQMGVSYTSKTGFLTDPYKLVGVLDLNRDLQTQNESRPGDRKIFAWVNRYRLYFEESGTAFHGDYRYYSDNWAVSSHTFDTAVYRRRDDLLLVGGVRYYTQSGADFYAPFYASTSDNVVICGTTHFCSSDYRLSDFNAITWRVRAEKEFEGWTGVVSYEMYDAKGDSPAIIDFDILAVGFNVDF